MIENPEQFPLAEVEWIDSTAPGVGGWISLEELVEENEEQYCLFMYSSGYIIRETEVDLWIASSYFENKSGDIGVQGLIAIPKVAIVRIDRSDKP